MNAFHGNDREKLIRNLQKNLKLVRQAAGWEQQQLADLIGVSRQTINNIENQKSPMSATQYVAISAMLDWRQKEKPGLNNVIEAVLMMEDDDQPGDEEYKPNFKIIDDTKIDLNDLNKDGGVLGIGKAAAAAGAAIGAVGGPIGMVAGSLLGGWLSRSKKDKGK